jgi:hypothetical protein
MPDERGDPRAAASRRARFALLNLAGGSAVLASYAYGFATHPAARGDLWGGVPEGLRPLYTLSMLLAAAGYFPFTGYLLFGFRPERQRVAGRAGWDPFPWLYAAVLFPSALWLPLTFRMLEAPGDLLWWGIRLVLALVAAGSLGVLFALLSLRPREPRGAWWLAVLGCAAFCFQTALLDALVWPHFFPR